MQVKAKRIGRRVTLDQALSQVFSRLNLRGYKFSPEISAVEQELADALKLHSRAQWYQQVEAGTDFATFYLDMACRIRPDRAIGIECDGYPYHEDTVSDFCRDALILGKYNLSCIYRIEAWAVRKRRMDWLCILSHLEPGLFTDDSAEAIDAWGRDGAAFHDRSQRFITRLTPEMVPVRRFLEFARSTPGIKFKDLVERTRRSDITGLAA